MSAAWTSEEKQELIAAYVDRNPTPENSMDIVKELAEEYEKTVNGTRMILQRAEVYVKKAPAEATAKKEGAASTRVSKAQAQEELTNAITAAGAEVDAEIIEKLTGKAAVYLAGVIAKISNTED